MSSFALDPTLRGVLEDVVRKSPASSIFAGFSPTRFQRAFRLPDQTLGVARAGLGAAERELISVHREGLARVLRQAFRIGLDAVDQGRTVVVEGNRVNSARLERRARALARNAPPETFLYRSGHYLRRTLDGQTVTRLEDLSSLLIASLRLQDSGSARLYHAKLDLMRGREAAAHSALVALFDTTDGSLGCYARELWSWHLMSSGLSRDAGRWVRLSAEYARAHFEDARADSMLARFGLHRIEGGARSVGEALGGAEYGDEVVAELVSMAGDTWSQENLSEAQRQRVMEACQS